MVPVTSSELEDQVEEIYLMNNTDLLNIASIYKKTLQMLASYRLNTNDSNQQPFYISFRTI